MKRLKTRLHKESAIHRHDSDTDVPVTEQEKLLCKYIPDEIEEFCAKNGLEVTCGANWHNPGEEQHIEIYVGIPEGDDSTDPKYDNIEENLEMMVNGIGDAENEGEKWGDASFQWISDNELFGELWPIDGQDKEMINENRLDYVSTTGDTITLSNDCPICGKHQEKTFDIGYEDFLNRWMKKKHGALIQDVFPELSEDDREFLMSGTCPKCWEMLG